MAFHINGEGNPGLCRAKVSCPFGSSEDHYSSKEKAAQAYERMQGEAFGSGGQTKESKEIQQRIQRIMTPNGFVHRGDVLKAIEDKPMSAALFSTLYNFEPVKDVAMPTEQKRAVVSALASRKDLSPSQFAVLARSGDSHVEAALETNPALPEHLQLLAAEGKIGFNFPDEGTGYLIASNPNLSPEAREVIFRRGHPAAVAYLALRKDLDLKNQLRLVNEHGDNLYAMRNLVANGATKPEAMASLQAREDFVRHFGQSYLERPSHDLEVLKQIARKTPRTFALHARVMRAIRKQEAK